MRAMIMAAGEGTRLQPLTLNRPKPMVPVVNRPLMDNILGLLARHGIDRVIANLHYRMDFIKDYYRRNPQPGVELAFSEEEKLLGTAGGVKKCEWYLDDTFVVISGDALTDFDLSYLVDQHRKKGSLATIALNPVEDVSRFGVVITEENGLIKSFQEKPAPEKALSNLANTGIYVFEKDIFQLIPPNSFYDFGKQLFPLLVEREAPFYGVSMEGYWSDVGNLEIYRQANMDVLADRVDAPFTAAISADCDVASDVEREGGVVLGAGCLVASGAYLKNSVIWEGTSIGKNTILNECLVGKNCTIGNNVVLGPGSVIGDNTVIMDGVQVIGARIWPDQAIGGAKPVTADVIG